MKAIERIDHYESTADYMAKCLANPDKDGASHINNKQRNDWAGASLRDALKLQREGWSQRPDISKLANEIDISGSADLTEMVTEYSVQGSYVDVPTYLEGVPECMVEFVAQPAPKVVRIGFNLSTGHQLSSQAFANRGAVIMAIYNKIASAGYSVEVVTYTATSSVKKDGNKRITHKHCTSFVLKRSDQWMDEDELAFWCCHPSALRRCEFMHKESLPEEERRAFGYYSGHGYGVPLDLAEFDEANEQMALDCKVDFRSESFEAAVAYYNSTIEEINEKLAS